jgi:hypothetical protein
MTVWIIFVGVYLLLVLQLQWGELAAAGCAAGLVAVLLLLIRERAEMSFVGRWSWIWLLAGRLPAKALADCAVLLLALRRAPTPGEFRAVPFDRGFEERPGESAARRALVITGASLPPNTVVLAVDENRDLLLCHQLVPTRQPPGDGDRLWPL